MISVIIPVYNEANYLSEHGANLFGRICLPNSEVIVVNGSSSDSTLAVLEKFQETYSFSIITSPKGRAVQMNTGAKRANGEILFFLFCDCLPEEGWKEKLLRFTQMQYIGGVCYFTLESNKRRVKIAEPLYNQARMYRRRFGDSGIIVQKNTYTQLGGFNETMMIEEDNDFITRMWKLGNCTVLPIQLSVSDRMFVQNGYIKTYMIYIIIHLAYLLGCKQTTLLSLLKFLKGTKN